MSGLEIAAGLLGGLGTATSAAGTLMGANSEADALEGGRFNQLLAGQYRAQALKQAADDARATGQRKSFELDRNKDQVLSTARARAAASGGGASDASVIATEAGIEHQGEHQKALEMYSAETEAMALEHERQLALIGAVNKDAATQYQAKAIRQRAMFDTTGTILSGASDAFNKYYDDPQERRLRRLSRR